MSAASLAEWLIIDLISHLFLSTDARAGQVQGGAAGTAEATGATGGSIAQQLTRLHRMTIDEAKDILNVKFETKNGLPKQEEIESMIKVRCVVLADI